MLLLIDNYDSFTYNLYQYLCELGQEVKVVRNDAISADEIEKLAPERIVISPGPGRPEQAGISNDVVLKYGQKTPILGVCLGLQCIGHAFGGVVDYAGEIKHGKTSMILHDGKGVFKGLPNPFAAVRYHSLAIRKESLPDFLVITAKTENGIVMGVRHEKYPIEGIQFHPESMMTKNGKDLLKNFIRMERAG
jgi:anthranilate synthase/aminodeoxychorismate synthase-like glutamine amidotransferase